MKGILACIGYLIVLYLFLFGSQMHLGPISARNLMTFLFFLYFIWRGGKLQMDLSVKVYLIFLFIYLVSNIINGEFFSIDFLRVFLGNHFACVIAIMVLSTWVNTSSKLIRIIKIIVTLYIINILLSAFQFYNSEWAWLIAIALSEHAVVHSNISSDFIDSGETALNRSIVMGITGFVVTNGYFIAVFCSVVSYKIWDKYLKGHIVAIIMIMIALYGAFLTQQRMAMFSVILLVVFIVIMKMKLKSIPVFVALFFIFYSFLILNEVDLGRFTEESDNSDRFKLFETFSVFVDSPLALFGGLNQYLQHYGGRVQHNVFLGAWVGGGFFSMVLIVILFFSTCIKSLYLIFKFYNNINFYPIIFALACLVFNFYSLTHSSGLHTGEPLFWISYSLMNRARSLCIPTV